MDSALPMTFGMIEDPISNAERLEVARLCAKAMRLEMPSVMDRIDDEVNLQWHAWPERLYLVDKDGKIAYCGGPGPFGFHPDELEQAIQKQLGAQDG